MGGGFVCLGHEIEEWLDKQETCCMMRWRVVSIIQLDRSMLYILNNSLADLLYYIHTCTHVYIYMSISIFITSPDYIEKTIRKADDSLDTATAGSGSVYNQRFNLPIRTRHLLELFFIC